MSDYSQLTFFEPKDSLATSDPNKIIRGADVDPEFAAIAVAIASKYDVTDLATQAEAEAGASNTVLMTPLRAQQLITAAVDLTPSWDEDAEITGGHKLTVDNMITLVNTAAAEWNIAAAPVFGANFLLITPPDVWTTPAGISLVTRDTGGSPSHTYVFSSAGELTIPTTLIIKSDDGTTTPSSLTIWNYDWDTNGDGLYTILSEGGHGVDARLIIRPRSDAGIQYTGEVSIVVGDLGGTSYTWRFDQDGTLKRNGTTVLP